MQPPSGSSAPRATESNFDLSYKMFNADPYLELTPLVGSGLALSKLVAKAAIAAGLQTGCLSKKKLHKSFYFTWIREQSKKRYCALLVPVLGQIGVGISTFIKRDDYRDQRDEVFATVTDAILSANGVEIEEPVPPISPKALLAQQEHLRRFAIAQKGDRISQELYQLGNPFHRRMINFENVAASIELEIADYQSLVEAYLRDYEKILFPDDPYIVQGNGFLEKLKKIRERAYSKRW